MSFIRRSTNARNSKPAQHLPRSGLFAALTSCGGNYFGDHPDRPALRSAVHERATDRSAR
ncbi:hypothetical protein O4328_28615 [Rhodococcus opacus]|uniref:Lipoprotein n=1 Tax=Rhodococcus opacus TaxID=37919 RepID=A0AAX3YQN5_RHOOP|nr:hypothetical protein [Rhodococcus opacus]MCZ4587603.1 hypothetical protein [Rhodococcus opacus]WLF51401.1 hypothetical protein Q5707_37650 [Rhodococcus opacus]